MKKIFLLIIIILFGILSCNQQRRTETIAKIEINDNAELRKMYQEDQNDRKTDNINWSIVSKKDRDRESRVYQLLDSNKVITANDYYNAAMLFQHGKDSVAYGMAVELMRSALKLDSTINKWLLAAATDRELMSRKEPQIYGTQYRILEDQSMILYKIDTTKVTDKERIKYGVRTLKEQKEYINNINRKKLSKLLTNGKSVDEIVKFIKNEDNQKSEYDISENGINVLGYHLMAQENYKEAIKIFELNTKLFPDGFNTYDSYGECLLRLGDKKNAIIAYEKSLKLNPKNNGAKKILSEIK